MASSDLDSYLDIIYKASKGEDVRDAIINAVRSIRVMTKNAGSLGGYDPDYFADKTSYLTWYDRIFLKYGFDSLEDIEDDDYAITSTNIVTSANLYGILSKYVRPSMSNISRYENDPNTDYETKTAIQNYLKTFKKVKKDIGNAIKAKGKKPESAVDFRGYAELISNLDDTIPGLVTEEFKENKEYDAGENQTEPRAYSSFTVKLDKSKYLVAGSGDENGKTYTPPEGKLFSSFDVNVKTRSGSRASATSAARGRSKGSSGQEILDENGLIGNVEFTENTTYIASDEGAAGYSNFTVNVKEPEVNGTYTVRFMNDGDELAKVTVAAYDTAYYEGETPVSHEDPSLVFAGWLPIPYRVTESMEVQAMFKPADAVTPGEIPDSWETIIGNRGSNYSKGSYKSIPMGTIGTTNYGTLVMEKVADGESSSSSTWISKNCLPISITGSAMKWAASGCRDFLNNKFLELLSMTSDGELIANNIVPVLKQTITTSSNANLARTYHYMMVETVDRVWVPSAKEIFGLDSLRNSINSVMDHYYNGTTTIYPNHSDAFYLVENKGTLYSPISQSDMAWVEEFSDGGARSKCTFTGTNFNSFIRTTSTAGAGMSNVGLRSLGGWHTPNGAEYPSPDLWGISSIGKPALVGDAVAYLIGFCL